VAAGEKGGAAPCVLNAANEVAVASFLAGCCGFTDIVAVVERTLETAPDLQQDSIDAVQAADAWARRAAGQFLARAGSR
jgi:1-deoxy-D-xylulose-5-phosphate reductoisomerase